MTSPEDSNLGQRWLTANHKIPIQRRGAVGVLRVHAEEDVNHTALNRARLTALAWRLAKPADRFDR